MSFNFIL